MGQVESSPAGVETVEVAIRLRLVLARLVRLTRQDSQRGGLTLAQLSALGSIENQGPIRLGDLALMEGVVPSTMTRLVAGLEQSGLVRRASARDDGRSIMVSVTTDGSALLDRLRGDYVSELADRLHALSPDAVQRVAAALSDLELMVSDTER